MDGEGGTIFRAHMDREWIPMTSKRATSPKVHERCERSEWEAEQEGRDIVVVERPTRSGMKKST